MLQIANPRASKPAFQRAGYPKLISLSRAHCPTFAHLQKQTYSSFDIMGRKVRLTGAALLCTKNNKQYIFLILPDVTPTPSPAAHMQTQEKDSKKDFFFWRTGAGASGEWKPVCVVRGVRLVFGLVTLLSI
jgi:hypothetical protein